jgi:8-oxo-dGTP pyrophosphatase MutT (NUDIX family)
VPSSGAIIFNSTVDKLLFIVYNNPRDRVVKKLDFPKGKIDQFEDLMECALREIYEETGLILQDRIDVKQVCKVETIKNRMINLYLIRGINERALKPVKTKEV